MLKLLRCLSFSLVACSLGALSPAPAAAISSTFDTDLEGWEAWGLDYTATIIPPAVTDLFLTPNAGDMVHESTGGNPDGYARLTDAIEEPSSFALAPSAFTGDLSAFAGGTLSFDHKIFDRGTDDGGGPAAVAPYVFLLTSGDLFDLNTLVYIEPPVIQGAETGTDWVHFDIALDLISEGGDLMFIEDVEVTTFFPDFPLSGTVGSILGRGATADFETIMGDVSSMLLPFELADNEGNQMLEWAGLDNVELTAASTPEPAIAPLLLIAGALLARRHSR